MTHFWLRLIAGGVALAGVMIAAAAANAQRTPVYQSGVLGATAPVGSLAKFFSNGLVGSAGNLDGDASGFGLKPFVVTDGLGLGICTRDADTAARRLLCLGHDSEGNALLTVDSYGGASTKGLRYRVNGITVDPTATGSSTAITATGGTTPTTLANLAARILSVEDFGGVADGVTDNLAAFNAAIASFTYSDGTARSGGEIRLNKGVYYVSGSINVTAKHGLVISGQGLLTTTITAGTGDYPVFTDLGSYLAPTNKVIYRDMQINCGGKTNTNGHGIQSRYSNTSRVERVFFTSCKRGIDLVGVWQMHLTENRWDGLGAQQNETCLWMDLATDVNDAFHNNTVVAHHNVCQNYSAYGARLINAQGSIFDHNQWLGGVNGVYGCDPPSATTPDGSVVLCQFVFFDQDQADTTSGAGWKWKRGLATAMGTGIILEQPWAGNTFVAAFDIENANGMAIYDAEIQTTDVGFKLNGAADGSFTGHIGGFNRGNDGSAAVLLSGTTARNVIKIVPESPFPMVGYNGISETGTYSLNQLHAGLSTSCGIGLTFGGAAVGMTYTVGPATTNQCAYTVEGLKVHVQYLITLSAKGSSTGAATLTGLPIVVAPAVPWGYGGAGPVVSQSGLAGLTGVVLGQAEPATTTANLFQGGATGLDAVTEANFTDTANFAGSFTYLKQ